MQKTSFLKIALTACAAALISISPAFSNDTDKNSGLQTPEPVTAMEHNNRAVELGSKGRWVEAIAAHEAAVRLDELAAKEQKKAKTGSTDTFRMNLSSACLHYGNVLSKDKKYDEAKKIFQKALEADSKNQPARAHLQRILDLEANKESGDKKLDSPSPKTP